MPKNFQFSRTILPLSVSLSSTLFLTGGADIKRCDLRRQEDGKILLIPDLEEKFWLENGALKKVKDGLALTIEKRLGLLDKQRRTWNESYSVYDSTLANAKKLDFSAEKSKEALMKCVGIPIGSLESSFYKISIEVNPVDKEQEQKTREWLATKGIGGTGSGLFGRAFGSVLDLKTDKTVIYDCKI
ncbi:MAG: hypothetical protein NT027_02065 [Proteobacteria bacterium]|nr:hypothetical protein [Pseudomonadota bacterium]